jgi:hypothetical protein
MPGRQIAAPDGRARADALRDRPAGPAEPLLILLRRFATESAREEARLFCDELLAEDAFAPIQHEPISA